MWKVGDKIKFVKEGFYDSKTLKHLTLGKLYTIEKIEERSDDLVHYHKRGGYSYQIVNDRSWPWWIEPDSFRLYKNESLTEVEWLDQIKENFKD